MTVSSPPTDSLLEGLADARERTLELVAPLSDADVEAQHSPLMSPLAWDLAHIAAYEDLWLCNRYGERPLLRDDLAATYDAFETPRALRGDIELLDRPGAEAYLEEVRARVLEVVTERGTGDGDLFELVIRHEHQHRETMLQALQLARLDGFAPERAAEPPAPGGHTGLERVAVAAGPFEVGAPDHGFAYDNERPRHTVELPAFSIARTPITNATWRHFVEGGGYQRRTLWSHEAWSWKEQYDITHPQHWTDDGHEWRMGRKEPLDPDKPVVHVSWFEADAFARAHGARLPTEFEWEKAATWDQEAGASRPPSPTDANLDQRSLGTHAAGAYPRGAAPSGALGMLGDVWEWTASDFDGYPDFRPYPYREYSEVFFGPDYRVLRGGSWATARRVANAHFRNWDLPQRRQIFAGVRLAWDG
ncbi:MAG: ergothioneine biosynthesis protein EgtB, partial [Solirubrobacterales bacterium]